MQCHLLVEAPPNWPKYTPKFTENGENIGDKKLPVEHPL